MKMINLFLLSVLLGASGARAQEGPLPNIEAADTQADERAAEKDRLSVSLQARGELADRIIDNKMAAKLVDTSEAKTYADLRLLLLDWIKNNTEKAAWLSLHFKSGGGPIPDSITIVESHWTMNPHFLAMIKALNEAAADSRVSSEALESAARRLYEGSSSGTGAPPVVTGGGRAAGQSGGADFSSVNYADFKLNRAGLDRELENSGAMLEALRGPGGRGPAGAQAAYASAVEQYGAFVVAASSVRGRTAITAEESGGLEARRSGLRHSLAALEVRARTAELEAIASGLAAQGGRQCGRLADSATVLKGRLENAIAQLDGGSLSLKEFGILVGSLEQEYAAFYIKYSVYSGITGLKAKAQHTDFSCLYDYLLWRALAQFFPEAAYARARAELGAASAGLDSALVRADRGDFGGALEGLEGRAAKVADSLGMIKEAGAFNRAVQFFQWGILFRPLEIEVSVRNGKPVFLPVATFFRFAYGKL